MKGLLGAALLFAAMLTGCDSTCVSLCESGKTCAGASQGDCDAECDKTESLNEEANCGPKYDSYTECLEAVADRCETTACDGKLGKYELCVRSFCNNNPADANCLGL